MTTLVKRLVMGTIIPLALMMLWGCATLDEDAQYDAAVRMDVSRETFLAEQQRCKASGGRMNIKRSGMGGRSRRGYTRAEYDLAQCVFL